MRVDFYRRREHLISLPALDAEDPQRGRALVAQDLGLVGHLDEDRGLKGNYAGGLEEVRCGGAPNATSGVVAARSRAF